MKNTKYRLILFHCRAPEDDLSKISYSSCFEHGYTVLYGLPRFSHQRGRVFGPATPLALAYRLLETMLREERRWESSERHSAPCPPKEKNMKGNEISNPSNPVIGTYIYTELFLQALPRSNCLASTAVACVERVRGIASIFTIRVAALHENLCAPLFLSFPPHRLPTRP